MTDSSRTPLLDDDRVDPLMGPLTHVVHLPRVAGEPSALHAVTAHVADLSTLSPWQPDPQGSGCAFSFESARESALGEAVERYAGNYPHEPVARASLLDLSRQGIRALDPADLVAITDLQRRESSRLVPHDSSLEYTWLRGTDLRDGEPTLVPRDVVLLRREPGQTSALVPRMAGIAAGATLQDAVVSGLLELVERDATARWWLAGEPCDEIDGGWLATLPLEGLGPGLSFRVLRLHSLLPGVTVVCAVLHDAEIDVHLAGFAARPGIRAAALKAMGECFQLRRIAHGILDPSSWVWRRDASGEPVTFPLVPYRLGRDYMDALPTHRMTQLVHNLQYALDRRSTAAFLERLDGSIGARGVVVAADAGDGTRLRPLEDPTMLAPLPGAIVATEVTTSDVEALGYRVVRVTAPDLLVNAPEAYHPWRDVARLHSVQPHHVPPMPHA